MKRFYTSLCLIALLVCTITSCNQTTNNNSEPAPSSSLSEISQPEPSSSVPESVESEENTLKSSEPTENFNEEDQTYTQEEQEAINDFITFDVNLISFVGQEEFEAWARTFYAQDKPENVKTFIDYFQIDYDTFWEIFETDYNERQTDINAAGYHSVEEYMHSYYTDEELNALFYGDEAAIRAAFCLPDDYPVF